MNIFERLDAQKAIQSVTITAGERFVDRVTLDLVPDGVRVTRRADAGLGCRREEILHAGINTWGEVIPPSIVGKDMMYPSFSEAIAAVLQVQRMEITRELSEVLTRAANVDAMIGEEN
jgi:hypothetical protein